MWLQAMTMLTFGLYIQSHFYFNCKYFSILSKSKCYITWTIFHIIVVGFSIALIVISDTVYNSILLSFFVVSTYQVTHYTFQCRKVILREKNPLTLIFIPTILFIVGGVVTMVTEYMPGIAITTLGFGHWSLYIGIDLIVSQVVPIIEIQLDGNRITTSDV